MTLSLLSVCLFLLPQSTGPREDAAPRPTVLDRAGRLVEAPAEDGPLTAVGDFFVECTRAFRSFRGVASGDQFGWVSCPIPDITGDGVMEYVITAPFTDVAGANAGRVFLRNGATGTRIFRKEGGAPGENLGYSARDAGDVDGDGVCDIIVGGNGTTTTPGVARIYSGGDNSQLLFVGSGQLGDSFGYSVTGLGDVNGDGLSDFAVGAILDDTFAMDAGRVRVFSGADGSVLWTIDGEAAGDNFGSALARLADVTNDGVDELIVGAMNAGPSNRGKAYLYDVVQQTEVYSMLPDGTGSGFGQYFVADCGDVDADGVSDVYISDFADGGGRGKAYVFEGDTGILLRRYTGQSGSGFGIGRGAGDVNGDGHADLILCGWTDSSGAVAAGKCEVFSGADSTVLKTITSTTAGEALGFDAHGMGDLDGDGELDYLVTAASNSASRGTVYVIAGGSQVRGYGAGLAGTGGIEPILLFRGCPELGESVTIETSNVLGDAPGLLILGTSPVSAPVLGGTLLTNVVFRMQHVATGATGVAGAGAFVLPLSIPLDPAFAGLDLNAQALYVDPQAPRGVSFTRAVTFSMFAGL